MNLYTEAHNLAFPLKTTQTPNKYKNHSPWITKGLIQSSLTQANLLLTKLKNPTEANIQLYKTFTTLYKKLLRIAKRTYFEVQLNNAKHDMKETWNILRLAMNKNKSKTPIPEHFDINNNKVTDKQHIVN